MEMEALREVYTQLNGGNTVLRLTDEHRSALLQVMQNSTGQPEDDLAERILATFSTQSTANVHLDAHDAQDLRAVLQPLCKQTNTLIKLHTFDLRMNDVELCKLIHHQLQDKNVILLPETEIYQFVDIINRSIRHHPHIQVFQQVANCLLKPKIQSTLAWNELLIRITLPEDTARTFCTMLEAA